MNRDDYFYYIHITNESDYMSFFNKGLIDYTTVFSIGDTLSKLDENEITKDGLEKRMKNSDHKNVFLVKIPKCYFPDRQHRDGSFDVPIPIFYEIKTNDPKGRIGNYPVLIPNLIQGCYNKEKGFITNPNFCPVFDPSGLKFAYEQLQPMRNQGYGKYPEYMKRNNESIVDLYNFDKKNKTWEPFIEYYARKFNVDNPAIIFKGTQQSSIGPKMY